MESLREVYTRRSRSFKILSFLATGSVLTSFLAFVNPQEFNPTFIFLFVALIPMTFFIIYEGLCKIINKMPIDLVHNGFFDFC